MNRLVFRMLAPICSGAVLVSGLVSSARAEGPPPPPPVPSAPPNTGGWAPAPGGLLSDQVAQRAAETSYDASAQRQAMVAASAAVDQAFVSFLPKLTLLARYTRLSSFTPPAIGPFSIPLQLDSYLLQGTLTVPVSDYLLRTSQAYAGAKRSEKAAALNEQAARLKAAFDGRAAYYAWVRSRGQWHIARQTLDQAKGHLVDAKHAFDAGTVSRADVLNAEAHVASAELLVEQATNLVSLTEEQVRVAMHDSGTQKYEIGEDLHADLPPLGDGANVEALRNEAMTRRPEVLALEETIGSLKEQARVVRAGALPRLDAFGDVYYANPNPRYFIPDNTFHTTWDVGASLTWSPNDALASSSGGAEAQARAAQMEAQKSALRDALRLEVLQAFQANKEALVAMDTSARDLASAEEAYRVRQELYKNGRATDVEVTDAQTVLLQARLAWIDARIGLRLARARLMHATGRDAGRS